MLESSRRMLNCSAMRLPVGIAYADWELPIVRLRTIGLKWLPLLFGQVKHLFVIHAFPSPSGSKPEQALSRQTAFSGYPRKGR
jgi:hypothetical protein